MNRNIGQNKQAEKSETKRVKPRELVERLRLEAALRQRELTLITFENLIVVPFPGFKVGLITEQGEGNKMTVHIRTPLGEVLMVETARELLASRSGDNGAQRVELHDDASLWVTWSREFDAVADAKAVMEAFQEQLRVAYETQRVAAEECYFSAESVEMMKQEGGRY